MEALSLKQISLTDGPTISLEQILQAREDRVINQNKLLKDYKKCLVSLTLVIPGAMKSSSAALFIFNTAIETLTTHIQALNWPILNKTTNLVDTGPEAFFIIDAPSKKVKKETAQLEDTHPLGRLWDMDIISPLEGSLSRRSILVPPRQCLVCDQVAHACARSRTHTLEALQANIMHKINSYLRNQC